MPTNNTSKNDNSNHSWTCLACTFINKINRNKCQICETNRGGTFNQKKGNNSKKPKLNKNISIVDLTLSQSDDIEPIKPKKKTKSKPKMSNLYDYSNNSNNNSQSILDIFKPKSKSPSKSTFSHNNSNNNSPKSFKDIFKKPSNGNKSNNTIDKHVKKKLQTQQWIDKYAPKKVEDMYIHKRKLNEIENWFKNALMQLNNIGKNNIQFKYTRAILFLMGNSGIGKTSIIRCLCNRYNCKLYSWPNSNHDSSDITVHHNKFINFDDTYQNNFKKEYYRDSMSLGYQSELTKLKQFLSSNSKFNSVLNKSNQTRKVTLIESIPSLYNMDAKKEFEQLIDNVCNTTRNMVIFEITTSFEGTKENDLSKFGANIQFHSRVQRINMNAVNKTLTKKCIQNILQCERLYQYVDTKFIDNIIESCNGDLRNSIQTCQIKLVQKLDVNDSPNDNRMKPRTKRGKGKSKRGTISKLSKINVSKTLNIGGRDTNLSIFHSIGKILYAKSLVSLIYVYVTWVCIDNIVGVFIEEMGIEEIIERSSVDCVVFNDLMYENFGDFFVYNENINGNHDKLFELYCNTLDSMSDADICCEYYNKLRYQDTSVDLTSNVNNAQLGSQLYPSLYSASIACMGYLNSHNQPCKLKIPGIKKQGLRQLRGSQYKISNKLNNELKLSINDVLNKQCQLLNNNDWNQIHNMNQYSIHFALNEHNITSKDSIYTDILPILAQMDQYKLIQDFKLNSS